MKKQLRNILCLAVVIITVVAVATHGIADGEMAWDEELRAYMFATPHYGIVICTQMNVRIQPDTRAKSLGKIKNGQPVKVLGITEKSDFYILDVQSCGINNAEEAQYGYVKSSLLKLDPAYIYSAKTLNLYSTPWSVNREEQWYNAPKLKNGEQDNRYLLVIEQSDNWYAVQSSEDKPGTAFVRIKDVPINNMPVIDPNTNGAYYYTPIKYVVTWEAPLLDAATKVQTNVVKKYTAGEMLYEDAEYIMLVFNKGMPNEYRGLVSKLYLAPIIN